MINEKKTKWDIGSTIIAGNNAYTLVTKHLASLELRLNPDELNQLKANLSELENHRSGQSESLVEQKSKTLSQGEKSTLLHNDVMSIRNIVKSNNTATSDIMKAYGVGEKTKMSVSNAIAGGNIIITAYNAYTDWSNKAGILESDITEISDLVADLSKAEKVQNNAMFTRKSKTMDKNVLQRMVEDEISKLSALGQHIFRLKDPAIAKQFENLIPSNGKTKIETTPEKASTTEEKTTA